jgi:hypothetical protein
MSFLKFEDRGTSPSGLTRRWAVLNSLTGIILGWIDWKSVWRKYTFSPMPQTIFDANCLEEIATFLRNEMTKRQETK